MGPCCDKDRRIVHSIVQADAGPPRVIQLVLLREGLRIGEGLHEEIQSLDRLLEQLCRHLMF